MDTQGTTQEYGRRRVWSRRGVALVGALAMTFGFCPGDTHIPEKYQPAKITVAGTAGNSCAPDTDIAVVSAPGVGQNNIGEIAVPFIQADLDGEVDACVAGFNPGTHFNPQNYAEVLDQFIETNHRTKVVVIVRSFGGIALMDTLRKYGEIHPNSGVKFGVIFMASPGGIEDLYPSQQVATAALSILPPVDAVTYAITAASMFGQGDKSPFDPEVWTNIGNNAKNTPSTLMKEQAGRMMNGDIDTLPETVAITSLAFIGDASDGVVKNQDAIAHIEIKLGKKIQQVIFVQHSQQDQQLGAHADDWLRRYAWYYKDGILFLVQDALHSMELPWGKK